MPETPTQTARRRQEERRSFTVRGTREIAGAQESALRKGYTSAPMPGPKVRPMRAPGEPMAPRQEPNAEAMGGAKDDPNTEIIVGPDGKIVRRRRS